MAIMGRGVLQVAFGGRTRGCCHQWQDEVAPTPLRWAHGGEHQRRELPGPAELRTTFL